MIVYADALDFLMIHFFDGQYLRLSTDEASSIPIDEVSVLGIDSAGERGNRCVNRSFLAEAIDTSTGYFSRRINDPVARNCRIDIAIIASIDKSGD